MELDLTAFLLVTYGEVWWIFLLTALPLVFFRGTAQ